MKYKFTCSIDFDGTVVDSNGYKPPFTLKDGVLEGISKIKDLGGIIIISSTRANRFVRNYVMKHFGVDCFQEMIDFLKVNGILYDKIDTGDTGKILADFLIDDKSVPPFCNWHDTIKMIKQKVSETNFRSILEKFSGIYQ